MNRSSLDADDLDLPMNLSKNKEVRLDLGNRSYSIEIGRGLEKDLFLLKKSLTERGSKVVAVIDEGLKKGNPEFLHDFLDSTEHLVLPAGEKTKSSEHLVEIWDFLARSRLDRTGSVFAVGGGVVGDLAGFAASSYLRGVGLYQVPTTLLAMVDSSVGGKTGINLKTGKNLVGSFHQPAGVFADLDALGSLPRREFNAGMAEVIKYGMLGNLPFYEQLAGRKVPFSARSEDLDALIETCCREKARIVQADEYETGDGKGGRALLNLGHTFAHAIEAAAGYGDYLHGEAVSVGLLCAFRLSRALGLCPDDSEEVLLNLLSSYDLPVRFKKPLSISSLLEFMKSDKKVFEGELRFVLMRKVGAAYVEKAVALREVEEVWRSVGGS